MSVIDYPLHEEDQRSLQKALNGPGRVLLERYSKIPSEEVEKVVRETVSGI